MTVTHQSPLLDPRSRTPRRRRWPRRVAIGIATTVSALLAALLDRASLVGHSFGGAWSLYFTEQHPERVERLVLLDAPALDAERAPQTRVFRIPVIGEAVAGLMGRGDFADSLCSAFHHQDRVKDEVIDETWVWFSTRNREAFWGLVRSLDLARTDAGLGKVESDTLILWGERDRWLPASQGTELAERIPSAPPRSCPAAGTTSTKTAPPSRPAATSFLTSANR